MSCTQCSTEVHNVNTLMYVDGLKFCDKNCAAAYNKTMPNKRVRAGRKSSFSGYVKTRLHTFDWGGYLDSINAQAASATNFKHCSHADEWIHIQPGLKLELHTHRSEINKTHDEPSYWIVTIIKVAGYKAKVRYEGLESDSSSDFWINILSSDCHPVGWSATNHKHLIPPKCVAHKMSNWKQYLLNKITNTCTLPNNFLTQYLSGVGSHKFISGMILEIVDKSCIAAMKVARVNQTVDGRLHLIYDDASQGDSNSDFWCHINSSLIHHVGWSTTVGHRVHASDEYIKTSLVKAQNNCYKPDDCTPNMFHIPKTPPCTDKFEVGMKLEAIDPLNLSAICVATIMKILKHGYLMIGIDGAMDTQTGNDWFCYHQTSSCLLPAGYCDHHHLQLTPPKDYPSVFSWPQYLEETKSYVAPLSLFDLRPPKHSIDVDMKLEAVDLMDPRLVCVATVTNYVGRLLKIHFDGWEKTFDQWIEYNSPDIYPVGWCEIMKYNLEGPKLNPKYEGNS